MTLANIDPRILGALRAIREGRWSYTRGLSTPPDLVSSLSRDLGYPEAWGDPARIPSLGGPTADLAWKRLGVSNRPGLGGIPCELVHGGTGGGSCVSNAFIRGVKAFAEAMLIYVPVCISPCLVLFAILTRDCRFTSHLSYSQSPANSCGRTTSCRLFCLHCGAPPSSPASSLPSG